LFANDRVARSVSFAICMPKEPMDIFVNRRECRAPYSRGPTVVKARLLVTRMVIAKWK
jgi:hypothetical protein